MLCKCTCKMYCPLPSTFIQIYEYMQTTNSYPYGRDYSRHLFLKAQFRYMQKTQFNFDKTQLQFNENWGFLTKILRKS